MLKEFMDMIADANIQTTLSKLTKFAYGTLRTQMKDLKDFDNCPIGVKDALINMIKQNNFNVKMATDIIDTLEKSTNECIKSAGEDIKKLQKDI